MGVPNHATYCLDEDTGASFPVRAFTAGDYQPGSRWLSDEPGRQPEVYFGKQGGFDLALKKHEGYLTVAFETKPEGFYKNRHIKGLSLLFYNLHFPENGGLPPKTPTPWRIEASHVKVMASDERDTDALTTAANKVLMKTNNSAAHRKKFYATMKKEVAMWRGMADFHEVVLLSRNWFFTTN